MSYKFSARFFDGKSIQAKDALAEVLPDGLRLLIQNQQIDEIIWPHESLQLMERFAKDKPAILASKTMLGARLVVENEQAYQRIIAIVPAKNIKLSHVHHPWRFAWLLLLFAAMLIVTPLWHFPLVSLWIANLIPFSWEQEIWDNEVKQKFVGAPECVSPEGKKALDKLVENLAKHTNSKHKFDIRVIEAPNFVNAESTPGFHIFIYSGLFKIGTPDGVAGVIAHEMGHSLKHHVIASFINEVGIKAFYNAVLNVSDKNIAFDFLNLKFRRDYELQADKIAIDLVSKANIDPIGFKQAMEYLAKDSGEYEGLEVYLVDHPPHKERITLINKKRKPKTYEPSLTPSEWKSLKNICSETKPMKF
ncbi:MAG: M48 family metallopeptidase [Candidatus Berkiella sp.]